MWISDQWKQYELLDASDGENYLLLFADGNFGRLQEFMDRVNAAGAGVVGVGSHTGFLCEFLKDTGVRIGNIPENRFESFVNGLSQD